jgi:glycerol uptake facilitator-like aquaporin
VPGYVIAQCSGAVLGVLDGAHDVRATAVHALATCTQRARADVQRVRRDVWSRGRDLGCSRRRSSDTPFAVGAYIAAAYWFTASTSFANPAVTLAARSPIPSPAFDRFDVPGFVSRSVAGAVAATVLFRWLAPALPETAQTS